MRSATDGGICRSGSSSYGYTSAVVAIVARSGFDESEGLRPAASVERASEHPLGAALVADANSKNVALVHARGIQAATKNGSGGEVDGCRVGVGNAAMMTEARCGVGAPCGPSRVTARAGADRHLRKAGVLPRRKARLCGT